MSEEELLLEIEKLKKENEELKVKCNKLLNDNFLLVAQYNNLKKEMEGK